MRFIIDNQDDMIQMYLKNGQWYDLKHLELMSQYITPGTNVIDVGANVGNHTIYFSKKLDLKTIYSIEPIPPSYKLLLCNIALNYCHNVNLDYIGLALGDSNRIGYPYTVYGKNNMGSTRLFPEETPTLFIEDYKQYYNEEPLKYDPVRIVSGDSIFIDKDIDFIKIDVEGMENVVLEGFEKTIKKYKPKIFIEVSKYNMDYFDKWLVDNNYKIVYEDEEEARLAHNMSDPNGAINYMVVSRI